VSPKNETGGVIIKFLKKGNIAKSNENELLLVDENEKAYKVDQTIVVIWSMCDGNTTEEQIVDNLTKETKIKRTEIEKAISDILAKLEQVGLIQKV
jgi:hypothetical protein